MRFIITVMLLLPLLSEAQYLVKGTVLRSDGSPLKSIGVELKKQSGQAARQSAVTDSSGAFSFRVVDTGSYELILQSLFYEDTLLTLTISSVHKETFLQPIRLRPLSKTLDAVTVTTKKEIVEFKDDHIVFNPSADATIGSRPVVEVLNGIPGIVVDAKNAITAKGEDNVQLLVNGRIIRMAAGDYLSQLNADEVERIEVYDNATRFAYAKASVVINIILKTRQPKKLWNAALNANTLPKINPLADASFSFGKQRVYARLSHDISNMQSRGYATRLSDTFNFYQDFNNRVQHQMSTARIGWDYFPDSATSLTIEGNYTRHTDRLNAEIGVKNSNDQFQNALRSSPVEKELSGFATYKKDLKQKGYKMLEFGFTQFTLENKRNLPGLPLAEERSMNNHSFGFKGEWQKNIGKLKILNGIFGQITSITDHIDTISVSRMLNSKFHNKSITSYHEATWQRKKWNVSIGANIDFINLKLNSNEERAFNYRKTFVNPSLRINRANGKFRTSLSYNRKYILPSTHMMFGQYSQYEYGRIAPGNYILKPSVQNLFKLSLTSSKKATTLLEFYYDFTQNPIMMINRLDGTVIIHQPENLKSRESVGAVFSISYPLLPYYNFTLNIDGRLSHYKLVEGTYVLNPRTWSGSSTLINRFALNKKMSFSVNASLHNWSRNLYRNMKSFITWGIQGSYKMNPRTNISFGVNDLFKASQFRYTGNIAPDYYETGFSRHRIRNISVSFRYQLINSQIDKKTSTIKSFMSE